MPISEQLQREIDAERAVLGGSVDGLRTRMPEDDMQPHVNPAPHAHAPSLADTVITTAISPVAGAQKASAGQDATLVTAVAGVGLNRLINRVKMRRKIAPSTAGTRVEAQSPVISEHEKMSLAAEKVVERTQKQKSASRERVQDTPAVFGGIALVLGVAAGLCNWGRRSDNRSENTPIGRADRVYYKDMHSGAFNAARMNI